MSSLYETLLIVTPEADDERINAVIGDLRTVVENDGGSVLQAGVWERRKLAYQVKGKSEGIYVLMYADGLQTLPAALKHRMKLDESVMRSMVVRLEDPQEADVREEIAKADHSHDDEEAERQRAAAERRHEAEQAAAAMSLEEQVAAEQVEGAEEGEETAEAGTAEAETAEAGTAEAETAEAETAGPEADEPEAAEPEAAEPAGEAGAQTEEAVPAPEEQVAQVEPPDAPPAFQGEDEPRSIGDGEQDSEDEQDKER